jgi:serine/threonine-protein kinase
VRPPEATTVAGAGHHREVALRNGEVVGERYQVLEHLAADPLAGRYRAFDQETEAEVCLRLVHQDLLPDDSSRRRILERLEAVLGRGGRYLTPLLDADRDGPRVYAIEPIPTGASLREVFDERFAEGRSFRPDEVLPLVARLAAALDAVPTGFRHGDVRPACIWMRRDGLTLSGGFLVSALPAGAVAAALQTESQRARRAPELAHGSPSPVTDLYGVALVALEALIGSIPESPGQNIPASLGGVGDALAALLIANPSARATSLDALLAALSRQADLPIPVVEAGVYLDERARSVRPLPGEPTDPTATPYRFIGAPPQVSITHPRTDGRLGIDLRDTFEDAPSADADDDPRDDAPTNPPPAMDRDKTRRINYPWVGEASAEPSGGETPQRSAEALASSVHDSPTQPRPTRAQRIEGAAAEGTQEITFDQIVEERERRAAEQASALRAPDPVKDLESGELLDTLPRRGRAVRPLPRKPVAYDAISLEGVKPIPRPKRVESILPPPSTGAHGPNVVLFDDSNPHDPVPAAAPMPAAETEDAARPGPRFSAGERSAGVTDRPPPMARRSGIGRWIVVGSLLAAVAIIAGSLLFATYRRTEADQERELRLKHRYEELRRQNADGPE